MAAERADVFVSLLGESNTKAFSNMGVPKIGARGKAGSAIQNIFNDRMGSGELRWCGTQFPIDASAQDVSMSLSEYEDFVVGACLLDRDDPIASW